MLTSDRGLIEAEAEARGVSSSEFIGELLTETLGVADVLFDCSASESLSELGDGTGGSFYQADSADDMVDTLISVTEANKDTQQDIVYLIDATGSMSDDIAAVRRRLSEVIEALDSSEDRVSMAWYRDKHVDDDWFDRNNSGLMAPGSSQISSFLDDIDASGGGDFAESLYDASYRVLDNVHWEAETRLLVVVTDAGASDKDTHTAEDVVALADEKSVQVVPILVGF
jgi:Mg-chelatase subunit ChlD